MFPQSGDTLGEEVPLRRVNMQKEKVFLGLFTKFLLVQGTFGSSQRGDTRGEEVPLRPVRERVQVAQPALQPQEG